MMTAKTLERWIWILIYGGLVLLVIGVVISRQDRDLGVGMILLGGLIAALGFIGIAYRSTIDDAQDVSNWENPADDKPQD